jgi:chromosome segregation ATPase
VRKKTQALLKAQHAREALQSADAVRTQEIWAQANREVKKATRERGLAAEQEALAQARVEELEAELTAAKTAFFKGQAERERLQQETERRTQQVWTQANSEVLKAQSETSDTEDRLVQAKVRIEELDTEVTGSKDNLFESQAQRERLREDSERRVQHVWTQANSEVLKAQSETSDVEDHLVKAQARMSELEDDVRRKTEALMTAERERERVQQESDQHLQEVWRTANAQTLAAQSETQDVRNELALRLARIEELEGELKAKAEALSASQQERDSAQQKAAQRIEGIWAEAEHRVSNQEQRFVEGLALAEERATNFLREAEATALATSDVILGEQGNITAQVEELKFEVSVLGKEVKKKSRELEEAQAQRDAANLEKAALERFVAKESAPEPVPVIIGKESEVPEA